ncbi:hypothetical protein K435DRAFT_859126 [Dendrothele bispora CBS 962.96]|uniref:Uncharacterized protein n=1 Tax=Dendrothele bispora (strain CBS 962.96) TaxID=1314807 RepID=A0A4S8M1B8_DENBC|nr:hypothetical protein K435DRAFT_859126 [Dendrothele bispora CBS 962.96]
MVKDQHPQAVKEAITLVLPVWLEAFKVLFNIDPRQDVQGTKWDGIAVQIQIFKTLDTLHFLPFEMVPRSEEDEPVLDFVSAIARGGRARELFMGETSAALISSIFNYIQMTDQDEEEWANKANAFVAQEDDDLASYSVRVVGLDLLTCLMDTTHHLLKQPPPVIPSSNKPFLPQTRPSSYYAEIDRSRSRSKMRTRTGTGTKRTRSYSRRQSIAWLHSFRQLSQQLRHKAISSSDPWFTP